MKESFDWVKKCIDSCKNQWQLHSSHRLIELFEISYSEESDCKKYMNELLEAITVKEALI